MWISADFLTDLSNHQWPSNLVENSVPPDFDCCGMWQLLERQWEAQSVDFSAQWCLRRHFWLWRQGAKTQADVSEGKAQRAMRFAFESSTGESI